MLFYGAVGDNFEGAVEWSMHPNCGGVLWVG